jgi:hypothetical protein
MLLIELDSTRELRKAATHFGQQVADLEHHLRMRLVDLEGAKRGGGGGGGGHDDVSSLKRE